MTAGLASFAAGFTEPAHAADTAVDVRGKHIAYITPSLDTSYWRYFYDGIKQVAAKHDSKVTLYNSRHSSDTQLKNAQDTIASHVDGIVLSPITNAAAPSVLAIAEKAKIPVVIGDIGTTSGNYVSFIISNNREGAYETGQILAKAMQAKGWGHGPVGMVTISLSRTNGKLRTEGFRQAMSEAGIKIVALNQMQKYTANETFNFVQDMLTAHPDMHGIFIETDQPTLGAARAIATSRKEDSVLLAGFDGNPQYVPLIRSGKLLVAGMQQPHLMGVRSAEALFDYLGGKTPPKRIEIPILVVTKQNLDKLLPTIDRTVFAGELKLKKN